MKIQCDLCNKEEASVFCSADEAPLCKACDLHVHRANKIASGHQRFSLQFCAKHFTLCDVCQKNKAFVFCHQDRATVCRECDVKIHATNEHTKKHNRYLLTGIALVTSTTSDGHKSPRVDSSTNGWDSSLLDLNKSEASSSSTTGEV